MGAHILFFLNQGWSWCRETGLSPPVKYFSDRSKAVLLLWTFYVFSPLCLLCLCARLFICALWSPAGKGLTSWLSFLVYNREFVTFPLVSWVRCGTWLYRFLIFTPLLTLLWSILDFDVKSCIHLLWPFMNLLLYSCIWQETVQFPSIIYMFCSVLSSYAILT